MFKAIIADDELNLREGLATLIDWESNGFVIAGLAGDGVEALELIERQKPDLVITDIKMPRMNGLELCKALRQRGNDVKIVVLSGYNDFSYAKEAIEYAVKDYLLKPVDPSDLSAQIRSIFESLWDDLQAGLKKLERTATLRNHFLQKLVLEKDVYHAESRALEYGISLHAPAYCMLTLEMERYGDMLLNLSGKEIALKKFAFRNVVEEILREQASGYLFESAENQYSILLIGHTASSLESPSIVKLANRIESSVRKYVKESVSIGVGIPVAALEQVNRSYQSSLKAMERKYFFRSDHIFLFEDVQKLTDNWTIQWDDTGLMRAVQKANSRQIDAELESLFNEIETNYIPLLIVRNILTHIVIQIARIVLAHNGDWDRLYVDQLREVEQFIAGTVISEQKTCIAGLCHEASQYINATKSKKHNTRMDEIIAYVQAHYADELNLKELSKLFYVNSVYLGQLFKKETGEYFNDYMHNIRIEHARRLLMEGELTITEISFTVGYRYPEHFYRHFKNIVGLNPGEIRKKI